MSKHQTLDAMLTHRGKQKQSGLSVVAYCKREGISPSSWWYWRKRLLAQKAQPSNPVAPISFLQLPTQAPEARLELTLPNGSCISMPSTCDPAVIDRVIHRLSALRPR